MKSIAIASAAILTTLSLAAAPSDPPPAPSTTTAAPSKTAATSTAAPATSTAAAPVQPPADSLAAAAQRTSAARGRKKAKISITNDNLSKTGGHITTSSGGGMPLPVTPEAATGKTVEQMVAEADAQRKAIAEQEKKKAEEERRKRMERAGNAVDGTALDADEDPALLEHRMAVAAQSTSDKPQQTTTQKPPL